MRFVNVRELRNEPREIWKAVATQDVVVTNKGRPVAVLLGIDDGDFDETIALLRRVRAQRAVSRMRSRAHEAGHAQLTPRQIAATIRAVRQTQVKP